MHTPTCRERERERESEGKGERYYLDILHQHKHKSTVRVLIWFVVEETKILQTSSTL